MDWPKAAIESTPPDAFAPPFCPWPACSQHRLPAGAPFPVRVVGSYVRNCDRRVVPRFRCRACRRSCSLQSFATTYYLKRPELLRPVAAMLQAGSAHRQIARHLHCAPSTVTRLSARLGRHGLLLHALALEHIPVLDEPIVVDHFEIFVARQEEALGLATPTGQRSWFVYSVDPAPHRRGGRRTPKQKKKAAALPPAPRRSFVASFGRVLDLLAQHLPAREPLPLVTDAHPAYAAALARHPERARLAHHAYPNPKRGPKGSKPSPEARRRDREMFAVDLLHKIWRHTSAHGRRETIAFARRTNAAVERGFLLAAWRNFVKGVFGAEARSDDSGDAAGADRRALELGAGLRPAALSFEVGASERVDDRLPPGVDHREHRTQHPPRPQARFLTATVAPAASAPPRTGSAPGPRPPSARARPPQAPHHVAINQASPPRGDRGDPTPPPCAGRPTL